MLKKLRARIAHVRRRLWEAIRDRHDAKPGGDRRKKLGKLVRSLRALKDKLLRRLKERINSAKLNTSPGSPHWGGSQDVIEAVVLPIFRKHNIPVTSGKRTATYGTPGSDHHVSQVTASAVDGGAANQYGVADEIRRALGVPPASDYTNQYFTYQGVQFRLQIIAGTHGTGPHLHVGIRR